MKETYRVPEANVFGLSTKLAKLNKRAVKLGMAPIVMAIIGTETEPNLDKCPRCGSKSVARSRDPLTRAYLPDVIACQACRFEGKTPLVHVWKLVEVTGEAPKLNGWAFMATLQHIENSVIFRRVPGTSETLIPVEYRSADSRNCDHCHTSRQRNDTYVVFHDDRNEFKQVGRNCLRDFTGHANPQDVAAMAELLIQMDLLFSEAKDEEWSGGSGYRVTTIDLDDFLATTGAIISLDGWLSKTKANETGATATAYRVESYYNPPSRMSGAYAKWLVMRDRYDAAKDADAVAPVIEWALAQADAQVEYLANLAIIARVGYVEPRTMGLAASMIVAYEKALNIERERLAPVTPSAHVGTIGEREVFTLTLKRLHSFEGAYGLTVIHNFEDANGNKLTWFASNAPEWPIDEARTIKATVKKHDVFRDQKVTILARVAEYVEKAPKAKKGIRK